MPLRPNGGTVYTSANTEGKCDGKQDADYPGVGTNQPCAAGNLRDLWADNVTYYHSTWVINGGDTVIVRQSATGYQLGHDNVSENTPVNYAGLIASPTIPSGTAAQHTQILGENYRSCTADSAKTLLIPSWGGTTAINTVDSQYVDVACFEITDQTACTNSGNYNNHCDGSQSAGAYGILQSSLTASVTYTDIFIDGIAVEGIHGATGVGVVANRVHVRAAPSAGVNMDDSQWSIPNISLAGGFEMDNSIIEFTGCVEEYPVTHHYPVIECRDQQLGAYGDGLGTAAANGVWRFDNDIFRYNEQDGLDLLHSGLQSLTVTNSQSYGNVGQTYKIGSGFNVTFQNNFALANCERLSQPIGDEPASAILPGVSYCRALDNIPVQFDAQGSDIFRNNTIMGYQSTTFDLGCNFDSCATANTVFQNNIVVGLQSQSQTAYKALPGLFYSIQPMPANQGWGMRDHNLYYNVKNGAPIPVGTGEIYGDPLFSSEPSLTNIITNESSFDNFNDTPTAASPAKGAGITLSTVPVDANGTTRPSPPTIGAVEAAK